MSIPYARAVTVAVTAGIDNAIELPAPVRGTVSRFNVLEVGGTDAFTARLFTAEAAAGAVHDLSDADDAEGLPPEAFAVTPALTGAGGKFESYQSQWGYESDEFAQPGRRQSSLWLKLTPGGSGPKTYVVAYTILMPVVI